MTTYPQPGPVLSAEAVRRLSDEVALHDDFVSQRVESLMGSHEALRAEGDALRGIYHAARAYLTVVEDIDPDSQPSLALLSDLLDAYEASTLPIPHDTKTEDR